MKIILYAIPGFAVLLLLEIAWDQIKKTGFYRLHDAVASIGTGMLMQTTRFLTKSVDWLAYGVLYALLPHGEMEMNAWTWVLVFVVYDFFYYWHHRMQHEINFLWGVHVVHHSSEEFNLSTALRQPFNGFVFGKIFYIPMVLMGVPVEAFIVVSSLNLVYQYWVHTRFIDRLGWYEKIFVTPSNHRVHHAMNEKYIDKNYGGVFILWDRLFGTFEDEDKNEPCVFGIRKPLNSWNPIWANFQVHLQLIKDAWHAQNYKDKFKVFYGKTGWRPADVIERYPLPRVNLNKFEQYDTSPSTAVKFYVLLTHAVAVIYTVWFLINHINMEFSLQLIHFIPLATTLWFNSYLLEARDKGLWLDFAKWLLLAPLPLLTDQFVLSLSHYLMFIAAILLINRIVALLDIREAQPQQV